MHNEIRIIFIHFHELAEKPKEPNNFLVAAIKTSLFPSHTINFGSFIKSHIVGYSPFPKLQSSYKEVIENATVSK